ncbi:competence type IV pilus minor pilin ComGD [Streptococcus didelphis]|uniref:Competence type IV pilus minor pilin ComGD n=1 Tax=Streptococcus didelphis TaxID=102886 RepID=A0ABY9LJ08_9STRE|nr:competence type IV pilus minor pilin ComGD [Streptococcus didelphis]WMB28773.1 competence type IV pilus minor pilin ComGD [Streptococcus didelphis]
MESLICLFIVTSMIILLSSPLTTIYPKIEASLFFIDFEQFYRTSQKLSVLQQEEGYLEFDDQSIRFGKRQLRVPKHIKVVYRNKIKLNKIGGNHSLAKIQFQTAKEIVTYQLHLGSGTYQKTRS